MTDPFKDAKLRLQWGKKHIRDLKRRIRSFIKKDIYLHVHDYDSDRRQEVRKIRFTEPLPDEFALRIADVVANLRFALDYAVFAILKDKIPSKNHNLIKFPFADTRSDLQRGAALKHFPEDIKPLFMSFNPYKTGNNFLWALNRICNIEKHRLLSPIKIACRVNGVTPGQTFNAENIPLGRFDRSKNEVIYSILDTKEGVEYNSQLTFAITFGEVEVVESQPVVIILDQFASMVQTILPIMEGEARRLGYIN